MKTQFLRKTVTLLAFLALTGALSGGAADANQLTREEKTAGWKLLFDGKTLQGWRNFKKKEPPKQGWVIEEGSLKHVAKGGGGDIITDAEFDDFELEWEWKVPEGANSGLKYFITEERSSAIGHEYQLVDDLTHPDARAGWNRSAGAFYHVIEPDRNKVLKPVGEWNRSRILVQGNHVEHWLNGGKVLEYELGSEAVKAAVAKSKFKEVAGFGTKIKGHILLQDHGDEIWFRNLKIRELRAN